MTKEYIGKICPFCVIPIVEGEEVYICTSCKKFHHKLCWAYNIDRCTTFGCKGSGMNADLAVGGSPVELKSKDQNVISGNELPPKPVKFKPEKALPGKKTAPVQKNVFLPKPVKNTSKEAIVPKRIIKPSVNLCIENASLKKFIPLISYKIETDYAYLEIIKNKIKKWEGFVEDTEFSTTVKLSFMINKKFSNEVEDFISNSMDVKII